MRRHSFYFLLLITFFLSVLTVASNITAAQFGITYAVLRAPPQAASNYSPQPTSGLATAVFYPSADAPVQQGAADTPAPDESHLGAGYPDGFIFAPGFVRSYLHFDLSSIDPASTIVSATLHLTQNASVDYPGTYRTVNFHRVTGPWTESGLTWNNKPPYAESIGSVTTIHGTGQSVGFDVTNQVRQWVSGGHANYGLVAVGPETVYGVFRSFTSRGYVGGPELRVRYAPAPPPVLDAWPGDLVVRVSTGRPTTDAIMSVSNVTRDTLDWTGQKVGSAAWLNLGQSSGSATPVSPDNVPLAIDATGLSAGFYSEQIRFDSNTPGVQGSPITTTVSLQVLDNLYDVYLPAVLGGGGGGTQPQKIVAILVGISDYQNLSPYPGFSNLPDVWGYDLYAPVFDVADMANWLQTYLNVPAGNIKQLTETDADLVDILAAFGVVTPMVDDDTLFIFYYSGHGALNPDNDGDEADGLDEFIATHDTALNQGTGVYNPVISDDDLAALLDSVPAGKMLVIIDSCYSGNMMSTAAVAEGSPDLLRRGLFNPADPLPQASDQSLSELIGPDRLILTGGTGSQLTWESYSLQNGVFTYFLLQALVDSLNDADGDQRISGEEAFWFSRDLVDDWVFSAQAAHQNPDLSDQTFGQVELTWLP